MTEYCIKTSDPELAKKLIDMVSGPEKMTNSDNVDKKPNSSKNKRSNSKTSNTKKEDTQEKASPSKEDVRESLKQVGEQVSFDAAQSVCQKFGATGLRDLKEKDYEGVIAECEKVLHGGDK